MVSLPSDAERASCTAASLSRPWGVAASLAAWGDAPMSANDAAPSILEGSMPCPSERATHSGSAMASPTSPSSTACASVPV